MLSFTVSGTPSIAPSASPFRQRASLGHRRLASAIEVDRDYCIKSRIDGFTAIDDAFQNLSRRKLAGTYARPSWTALSDQQSSPLGPRIRNLSWQHRLSRKDTQQHGDADNDHKRGEAGSGRGPSRRLAVYLERDVCLAPEV